jgi:long-chain acyl-CoA synthetase
MANLAERLSAACARFADRIALIDGDEEITYRTLAAIAGEVADKLFHAGIQADEPVHLAVSNCARDLAGFFGIWLAGGVAVPVHRSSVARTAAALAERTGARLLVNMRPELEAPAALAVDSPVARRGTPPPRPRPMLAGAALIDVTSGSTGEPKGVVLAHDRFARKLDMIDAEIRFAESERTLLVLQLTFVFGQWVSLLTLLRGGTLHLHTKFDAATVFRVLTQTPITRIAVVPTMLRALLPLIEGGRDTPYRGGVMAGGEPLPAPLGRRLRALWPDLQLGDIYGLTETGSCDFFVRPADYAAAAGSIGRPGAGIEFRLDPENGELQIKTPTAMRGYLDAPGATAAAFADGWIRTGDLARVRAEGRLELVGRIKDLILRAGNKISPLELERVFAEHADVTAVLAAGHVDPGKGEAIHLFVVARDGAKVDEARLLAWARERLDRYKLPDRIHFGRDLPIGRTGKADRQALRDLIASGRL